MDPAVAAALVAELGKKTSVCWLRYAPDDETPVQRAVWHVWHDGALMVVAGGPEQPLPGIDRVASVDVTMRSKENGGRLLTWVGGVRRILPDDPEWEPATSALATARLSIPSLTETPRQWAAESVVVRIEPTGELVEAPGSLPDSSHAAPPQPTPAITRGALPRVLHRRQTHRPRLS